MKKPLITIVNSSTFGKHFPKHIEELEKFAILKHITVPADIDAKDLSKVISDSDGIIASVTPKFTAETLEACSKLVLLVRHGIGCDNVDLKAATELGIMVSRVKGIVEKEAVAEYAVSLAMSAARFLHQGFNAVRSSNWAMRAAFVGLEIKGKTVGIIGLGNIGSRSAEIFSKGFQAKVIACDPYIEKQRFLDFGTTEVSLNELIESSDIILFHCPLTSETKRMLGQKEFAAMKKGAILVNTCRGELLDEQALYDTLVVNKIAYATDVVEGEPIDGEHRLAKLPNVLITPHLGGYSWESLEGMGATCVADSTAVFANRELPGELANGEVLNQNHRKWD